MKLSHKHKNYLFAVGALLLAVVLTAMYVPFGSDPSRAVCRVKARTAYALALGRGDTLYLTLRDDSLQAAATRPEALSADSADASGVFVSRAGHVITTDSLLLHSADSLAGAALSARLARLDTLLARRSKRAKAELAELDYYASTHSVIDDGYNEVMGYRETTRQRSLQTDSTLAFVRRALKLRHLSARRAVRFEVRSLGDSGRAVVSRARLCVRRDGLLLVQLTSGYLPAGASRLSVYAFGTYAARPRLFAHNDFGGLTALDSVYCFRYKAASALFPTAEGGAWVNASGQLCGVELGGRRCSSWRLAQLMRREHILPVWWAVNTWKWITGWGRTGETESKASSKHASAKDDRNEKHAQAGNDGNASPVVVCDTLRLSEGVYEGQLVRRGRQSQRQGYGTLVLSDGTRYAGLWRADTLVSGTRRDTLGGCYTGEFDSRLRPDGHGAYRSPDGDDYYQGDWSAGRREGHGFSSRPGHIVRCGAWRADRFRGERMVYTADRVYGIDISRHQHEKDGRHFALDWSALRITSLGSGRRVRGAVDYPVSYVYIKATEGRSLYNRYYPSDIRQARRRGIPVGSYHFFTATSSGAQQAAYFLRMAWVAPDDLPPVLDLEPTAAQIRQMGGRSRMFAQVLVWLRRVEAARGKRPVLYVGQQFVNDHLLYAPEALRHYDVWIARYGEYKPYVHLLHWQLTPHGRVRGIHGGVDINVFNGSREQFDAYRKSGGQR